jgi:hypothetical protein
MRPGFGMMIMNKTFAFALGLGLLSAGAAAAEVINCPLTQARREVTTALPGDGWSTPIVENLSAAEIKVIGGKSALVCRYGSAGSVQRYAPEGATCAASVTGFVCDGGAAPPAPPSGATVRAEGTVSLPVFGMVDLDNGSSGIPNMDVIHLISDGMAAVIVPQNGGRLSAGFNEEPGHDTCAAATYKKQPVVLADLLGGGWVCYKTNKGRYGQMVFEGLSGGALTLTYTTWE